MPDEAGAFIVSIAGEAYAIDVPAFERAPLPIQRQPTDTSALPGGQSLNPFDLWPRAQDDWVLGAGQEWFDRDDSVPQRFWRSRGIDPWDRGYLSLLPGTARLDAFAGGTVGKAINVGPRMYVNRGDSLAYFDGVSWTLTGTVPTGQTIRDLATDGFHIYIAARNDAKTAGGIYIVTLDDNTPTKVNDVIPDLVGFVKGRVMVAAGPDLYNITNLASTAVPDPLAALVNDRWTWDAFGEGPNYIYISGHSGDIAAIYRIGIREDGTALGAAAQAAPLPHGEVCYSILGYMGRVVLGTSHGVRLAVPSGPSLHVFPYIATDHPVLDLEPFARFVWFGWSETDGPGLGRLDLQHYTGPETPAWARDLEAVGVSGDVVSVLTFAGKRVFVVRDVGVFTETDELVPSGWYETGKVNYNLAEKLVFYALEWRAVALPAGAELRGQVFVDEAAAAALDHTGASSDVAPQIIGVKGEYANVRFTFTRATDPTEGPRKTRWRMRSLPVVRRSEGFTVPIDLLRTVTTLRGEDQARSPEQEFAALRGLQRAGEPVEYREWGETYTAVVDEVRLGPGLQADEELSWWQGPCIVSLRVFA